MDFKQSLVLINQLGKFYSKFIGNAINTTKPIPVGGFKNLMRN